MSFNIPHHLQQQFTEVISELRDAVGWEATKAYLSLLSHAVESNVSESNPHFHSSDGALPANPPMSRIQHHTLKLVALPRLRKARPWRCASIVNARDAILPVGGNGNVKTPTAIPYDTECDVFLA
jgi:hypothetical protein